MCEDHQAEELREKELSPEPDGTLDMWCTYLITWPKTNIQSIHSPSTLSFVRADNEAALVAFIIYSD